MMHLFEITDLSLTRRHFGCYSARSSSLLGDLFCAINFLKI